MKTEMNEFVRKTLDQLKREKEPYLPLMKKAAAYMRHRVYEKSANIDKVPINSTVPIDAVQTTINGVCGYLLSPSIRWFRMITRGSNFEKSDDLYGANDWVEDSQNCIYALYANSKFYPADQMAVADSIITGTSYEMITDKTDKRKLLFETYSPFECYGAENEDGEPDTFFREYSMTAKQAYKLFGEDLPQEIKRNVTELDNPNTEYTFVHAIFPREDWDDKPYAAAKRKRFASVHYSVTGDTVIKESGYDEFPLAIHRWQKNGNSFYGMGLVMKYITEIIRVNDLTKQNDIAIQFQASPTTIVPETLRNRFVFRPGYTNYANIQQSGKPEVISNQLNISYLGQQLLDLEQKLQRVLFADLFNILMRQEKTRTAYEVQEIKGEGLVLLSAIIGNMQVEKLNPIVIRTFRIMLRGGMLPPPPEELIKASREGRVEIELDGPLAQTMKQYHQATGLQQGLASIASVAQLFPDELAQFDGGEIARQFATAQGLPQSCIREKADVEKIKQAQAEAQQQAQQRQAALAQSQIYKNMGYDASTVPGNVPEVSGGMM